MENQSQKKDDLRRRLKQARESLEEARILLMEDAEPNFVMNSLYYAFLYGVFGLLATRGITASMQSTAISLFEREFVAPGVMDARFGEAVRTAFELRPACACEGQQGASPEDIEQLLPVADDFLDRIEEMAT